MAGNNYFQFKQFLINQDKCAMKVGTDSVLLALLHTYKNEKTALDIGTGSGIITLMMAQLNPDLIIDAIEIDNYAHAQAFENISNSKYTGNSLAFRSCYSDEYNYVARQLQNKGIGALSQSEINKKLE